MLTDSEPCPVASAYESYGLKKFMGREYMGMMRHTFVVDPIGKLEFIYLKVSDPLVIAMAPVLEVLVRPRGFNFLLILSISLLKAVI